MGCMGVPGSRNHDKYDEKQHEESPNEDAMDIDGVGAIPAIRKAWLF